MKKSFVMALALGIGAAGAAHAASNDDMVVRLNMLEKENAAIRKENAALRQNKSLREQNATLKSSSVEPRAAPKADATYSDPFGAFAADLPLAYKARPVESPGQFRVWGEGGAIWSGGDPVASDYSLTDFSRLGGNGLFSISAPGSFDLTPKVGWEAAAGFDYRFAASPWHVSGQFRYGEGKASGFASSANPGIDPALLAGTAFSSLSGSQSIAATNKETHWLADIAVGRDVVGAGASAMQVKFGLRLAEFVSETSTTNKISNAGTFAKPVDIFGNGSLLISQFSTSQTDANGQRSSFFGAGPRVGIEGSVPFAGNWAFDYLGDAAVLFGNQKLVSTSSTTTANDPLILFGGVNFLDRSTDQRFATVFNADVQAGVSYWMMPNLKLSASYRLDAYFNVLNQTFSTDTKQTLDRYIHGPRLGLSATF
ncbi:Lpg1974 family pore-forming outer membrane protein [Bradyrhizobium prioriisuperbiae]|uniref:Lpg1974 family pore-forming outer membrane protein n=1 Tax=Bradyrhizobium prioriisuperbiae TaxID=2854389 RepID=UPI0028E7428D|nr:Lpg1974 family pore-forming outer membrane protein [Bradyrhizobium prioritasuperba]